MKTHRARLRLEHVHDCEESGRWPAVAKITALDQIASSFAGYETHLLQLRGGEFFLDLFPTLLIVRLAHEPVWYRA
eukprot:CAMPEP_0181196396 /NCGR_PEP_ID=MMETSP1096-20121128/15441_1 /TAXON_ID=156174 ORGANISM="Chrysochromulina ericina, Strain CCMP281" /NCGR_SAMPLE_ID=MMETSP1096 /ASSEMBLY_ACC=CAM_ASM_000453 /LENGTH=75 /DNA_ID=CAMNT_0023286149 /DNA_START=845 /DNA_END=1072 /DNA_ORIENTATION=-